MKKKFKLFATIGSLALAVCMMTIGVLAANSVAFKVTSTVTFQTSSVFVGFSGKVERDATGDFTAAESLATKDEAKNFTDGTSSNNTDITWAPTGIAFVEGKQFIKYTITVHNYTDKTINVAVSGTVPTTQTGNYTVTTDTTGTGDATEFTVAAGNMTTAKTATWTCTIELENVAKDCSIDVSPIFTVTLAAAD